MEVFYLKININHINTWRSLAVWIEIIKAFQNPVLYLIVDNESMINYAKTKVDFRDIPHEIMKSRRDSVELQTIVKPLRPGWHNAGYAHYTPFLHARDMGYKEFWNIDGDDEILYASPERIVQLFSEVKRYARSHKIHAFSLECWQTWSFGITYTDNESFDWMKLMIDHCNDESYLNSGFVNNADYYLQYLTASGLINCKKFYVENLYVLINYAQDVYKVPNNGLRYWQSGYLIIPMLVNEFGLGEFGTFKIDTNTIKIDIGLTIEECQQRLIEVALTIGPNCDVNRGLRKRVELAKNAKLKSQLDAFVDYINKIRTPPPRNLSSKFCDNSLPIIQDYYVSQLWKKISMKRIFCLRIGDSRKIARFHGYTKQSM